MTCIRCKHTEAKRFGYNRKRIQRYRCPACHSTFSEPRHNPLSGHYIEVAKATQVLTLMLEGMSVRAASRITGLHQATILSLLVTVGNKSQRLFDRRVRNVTPRFVEADELWAFVGCKERHLHEDSPKEWGDAYTWLGIDAETKLIISYHVGKRTFVAAPEAALDGAMKFCRWLFWPDFRGRVNLRSVFEVGLCFQ